MIITMKHKRIDKCFVIVKFREHEIMENIQLWNYFYLAHIIMSPAQLLVLPRCVWIYNLLHDRKMDIPCLLLWDRFSGFIECVKVKRNYTPAQRSWRGGILDSPCPSVRPSVCRRHSFRSISQVSFGISILNFICILKVVIGRSLSIFSDITFKMAAWRPY